MFFGENENVFADAGTITTGERDFMSQSMNGAAAVIEALKREEVKYIFGLPGTTIMHLLDALAQQDDIRYITTRHEQVAAFMADGYARGSGELGVCMASRGPGAANMTIGIHNAYAESVPVLALLGQVADEIYYREAFEEMDLVKFYEPITKWSAEIHKSGRIPELLQRAVRTSLSGRPRPVMVSVPLDVQMENIPQPVFQRKYRHPHSVPPLSEVEAAARLLEGSEKPVVILGGGLLNGQAREQVVRLAEALRCPVLTSWLRKDVFPNSHELFFGSLGFGAFAVSEKMVQEADVILAVGCHFSEFATKRWTLLSPASKLIHIDIDEEEIGKIYVPEIGLVGDGRQTVELMIDILNHKLKVDKERNEKRNKRWRSLREAYVQESRMPEAAGSSPVPSQAVIYALQHVLQHYSSAIVQDAASFGVWMHRYLSFDKAGTFYAASGGSLGWGLPAAMGLKLARQQEHVLNVTGDGAFWMVAQDLETAVRENIPIINVITNNFSYGNTRDRQRTAHEGRYLGVFYQNPDFAEFAKLLGAYAERVEQAEQVLPAIERAIASGKPAVIDVIQDAHEGPPSGLVPPASK